MIYKPLTRKVELENLSEGDTINPKDYCEKLKHFKALGVRGTYIVDSTYQGTGEKGLHFYELQTLKKS